MHITKEYYTGPFCNYPQNHAEDEAFDLHPTNAALLNPAYPYLNQFLKNIDRTGICFGIALWKIEWASGKPPHFGPEEVQTLITSDELLRFQLWNANGRQGPIHVFNSPEKASLVTRFANSLHQMQVHGEHRVLVSKSFCEGLAIEFLDSLEATSGPITALFQIDFGWAHWFALDSHHDYGVLMVMERAAWLLTFSESD